MGTRARILNVAARPCRVPAAHQSLYDNLKKDSKMSAYLTFITRDTKRSASEVVAAITGLRSQEPVMVWIIDCYHYETRVVTTIQTDANGNTYPVTSTVRMHRTRRVEHPGPDPRSATNQQALQGGWHCPRPSTSSLLCSCAMLVLWDVKMYRTGAHTSLAPAPRDAYTCHA